MRNKSGLTFTLIALYQDCATGIRYLSSVLKAAGHNCNLVFFQKGEDPRLFHSSQLVDVIALIKELKTDIVGISVFSTYFKIAKEVTREIKEQLDIPVIWGGPHPTYCPDHSISYCDFLCVGEGELCIKQLADKMAKGEKIENTPNLWVKEKDKITRNELAPLITDLDSLPFPDFDLENKFYVSGGKIQASKALSEERGRQAYHIITSRGCPFPCTYCSNAVLNKIYGGKWTKFRRRSPENVVEELIQAKELLKISVVSFHDEVFATDMNWVSKFTLLYRKHVNLPFMSSTHPNFANFKTFSLLKEVGLTSVSMGIESGSDRMLNEVYHRHTSRKTITECHKIFTKLKLVKGYDVLFDNPYETEADLRETFRFLLTLKKPFQTHTFSYVHLPKTALTERALKEKVISEGDVEGLGESKYIWRVCWDPSSGDSQGTILKSLVSMTGNIFIANWFLLLLSHSKLLQKNPEFLARFVLSHSFERFQILSQSICYLTPKKLIRWINIVTTKRLSSLLHLM